MFRRLIVSVLLSWQSPTTSGILDGADGQVRFG